MYFTAHLRFYLCVLLVCLLAEPIGHAYGTPLKQLTPPKPTPLKLQPLGETRWTTFSVAPDRRRILVASPERLKLLSANLKTTHWNQETPGTTKLMTFSADGKICAVISYGDTGYSLATHSADDGTLLERVAFRFPNSGGSGRGYQPPDWPKALMPAPNGNGFLIHNAYGTFRVEAGKPEAQPVKANAALGRSAQDATSYWSWNGEQLTQTHGPKKAQIKLDCYPQAYVVDKALNRVVALCHPPKKAGYLALHELSSGQLIKRFPVLSPLHHMALLDANRVMALHRTPATLSWYSVKTGITHQGQGSDWKHIDLSSSKQLAVGISPGGTMQVLALKSGEIVCDHSRGAEVTIAGGFEDDTTLWTLGYVKGGFNKLELRQVDVNRCQITRRRPLGLGKTSNLLPRWISGAKAFVFNALTDKGWGAIMVYVDQNRANKMLWPGKTPFVYVSDHGRRFGLKDYSRVRLFEVADDGRITPTGEETKDFMALCREHSLLYSYKGGWSDYIIAATVQPSAFNSIQPQVAACYGHQLLLIAYQHMNLIDLKTVKITQAWQLPDRNPAIRLIDERRAILGGGETGWRLLRF